MGLVDQILVRTKIKKKTRNEDFLLKIYRKLLFFKTQLNVVSNGSNLYIYLVSNDRVLTEQLLKNTRVQVMGRCENVHMTVSDAQFDSRYFLRNPDQFDGYVL